MYILIPARYNSTRLPGKPLLKINNKTIINHVYENVKKIMREMYDYQNETNTMTSDIIGDVNNLFQEEETEGPIMMHQDDEYINEYGEEVDIDDNY